MSKSYWLALILGVTLLGAPLAAQDAGTEDGGGQGPCSADSNEPNDDFSAATAVSVPGSFPGLTACEDDDWFSFTVPADSGLVVDLTFLHADADLDLFIYDAAATGTSLHSSAGVDDNEKVVIEHLAAATPLLVKVKNYSGSSRWAAYSLDITTHPGGFDPCVDDDAREDNDDSSSPSALTAAGAVPGLVGCDEDWYSFSVPAANGVSVDIDFLDADANLNLYLYDAAATTTSLHSSTSSTDNESTYLEVVDQATQLLIRVDNSDESNYLTADYTLTVGLHPGSYEPCANEDSYEPNDDEVRAAPITAPGTLADLLGCDQEDWYSFTAPANNRVTVDIAFLDDDADLDMSLYDASDTSFSLDSSSSTSDNETVEASAFCEDKPLFVKVRNFDFGNELSATYTMTVTFTPEDCNTTTTDAGTTPTDSGTTPTDSGTTQNDAATSGTDSGGGGGGDDGGGDDGGCLCSARGSSGTGILLLVGLALLGLEVRRRRRG